MCTWNQMFRARGGHHVLSSWLLVAGVHAGGSSAAAASGRGNSWTTRHLSSSSTGSRGRGGGGGGGGGPFMNTSSPPGAVDRRTLYDVLGVSQRATQGEIKAAYYELSMAHHPDRSPEVEAGHRFREINDAYNVLGNFSSRRQYDRGLLLDTPNSTSSSVIYEHPPPSSATASASSRRRASSQGEVDWVRRASVVYNLDAWTTFHYGASFERKKAAKKKYEAMMEEKKEKKRNIMGKDHVVLLSLILLTAAAFKAFIATNPMDRPTPPPPLPPPPTPTSQSTEACFSSTQVATPTNLVPPSP